MQYLGTVVMKDGKRCNFGNLKSKDEIEHYHNTAFEKAINANPFFLGLRKFYNDINAMFDFKAMQMAFNKVLTVCNLTPAENVEKGKCDSVLIYAPDEISDKQIEFISSVCGELDELENSYVFVIGENESSEYTLDSYLELFKTDKPKIKERK